HSVPSLTERVRRGDALTVSERDAVSALEHALIQRVGSKRYQIWFEGHSKFARDGDALVVGVPNLHFQEWLQKTFADAVRAAATDSSLASARRLYRGGVQPRGARCRIKRGRMPRSGAEPARLVRFGGNRQDSFARRCLRRLAQRTARLARLLRFRRRLHQP